MDGGTPHPTGGQEENEPRSVRRVSMGNSPSHVYGTVGAEEKRRGAKPHTHTHTHLEENADGIKCHKGSVEGGGGGAASRGESSAVYVELGGWRRRETNKQRNEKKGASGKKATPASFRRWGPAEGKKSEGEALMEEEGRRREGGCPHSIAQMWRRAGRSRLRQGERRTEEIRKKGTHTHTHEWGGCVVEERTRSALTEDREGGMSEV